MSGDNNTVTCAHIGNLEKQSSGSKLLPERIISFHWIFSATIEITGCFEVALP